MKKYVLILAVMIFAGCEQPSMNLQRSAARDTGDTGITIYLDKRDVNDIDEKKLRILNIVTEIENFINVGEVGSLTVGALRKQINKVIPAEYQDLSDTILNYLSDFKVPTDQVPVNVIRNIRATLQGVKTGVDEYKIEDRKPEPKKMSEVK